MAIFLLLGGCALIGMALKSVLWGLGLAMLAVGLREVVVDATGAITNTIAGAANATIKEHREAAKKKEG